MSGRVEVQSRFALAPAALWLQIGTLTAANREMAPWLQLRCPELDVLEVAREGHAVPCALRGPLGFPLGPYPLTFLRAPSASGFLELTRTPVADWRHERRLMAAGDGTLLSDALSWRLRAVGSRPRSDRLVAAGVSRFFEHRHRQLHACLGGPTPAPANGSSEG